MATHALDPISKLLAGAPLEEILGPDRNRLLSTAALAGASRARRMAVIAYVRGRLAEGRQFRERI